MTLGLLIVGVSAYLAQGASQTWDGELDANWTTAANWVNNAVPGAVSPASDSLSLDLVTFNAALNGTIGSASNPIINDAGRNVRSILFDTANAGAYVIGTVGGNQLQLSHNGNVTISATVVNAQTILAPILIRVPSSTNAVYSFVNNSTTSGATLTLDTILSGTSGTRPLTITLDGSNSGNNTIGSISDQGTAGALAIVKSGTGTWIISGASTISSQTDVGVTSSVTINAGTLVAQNAGSFGVAANPVTVSGGTLRLDGIVLNANSVTLNSGSIIANGSSTVNGVSISSSASSVTLATTNAGDIFTIGNTTANKLTGGNASTVLNIGGPGTVLIGGASNYAGGLAFTSEGKLQMGGNLSLTSLTGLGTIEAATGVSATLTLTNSTSTTLVPVLQNGAGTLGLTKTGTSTLTIDKQMGYTGNTTVTGGGRLKLDFTGGSAPVTNIINGSSGLLLGGSTLEVVGASASSAQTFSSLTLTAGQSTIVNTTGATINLGTIAVVPLATTLRFEGPATINGAGNVAATGTVTTTTAGSGSGGALGVYFSATGSASGAAGGYATVGLYDFASTNLAGSGGAGAAPYTIIGGSQVTGFYSTTTPSSTTTVGNWDVTANATVSSGGEKRMSTTRFNTPTATTVSLSASASTATLLTGNAFLVTPNMGANNVTVQSSNTGLANQPIWQIARNASSPTGTQQGIIWQNNTLGFMNFNVIIADGRDAGDTNVIVKAGAGTLVLGAVNTYTGQTYINEGAVLITSNANLGAQSSGTSVQLNNGTLFANSTFALDNSGANLRPIALNGAGGNISASTGNTFTVSGVVSGSGALTIGSGTLAGTGAGTANITALVGSGTVSLTNTNTYTGGTSVNAGKLFVAGSIAGSTSVNSGGILGGTGSAGAITLNAGGAIDAGTTSDDLAATSFVWNGETSGAFAQIKFELSAVDNTSDKLTLSGTLTKGTGSLFRFDFLGGGMTAGTYTLMSFASQTGFNVADFSYTNLGFGLDGVFDLQSSSLVFTVVPEPGSIVSLLGGFGCLMGLQRLRRRAVRLNA